MRSAGDSRDAGSRGPELEAEEGAALDAQAAELYAAGDAALHLGGDLQQQRHIGGEGGS